MINGLGWKDWKLFYALELLLVLKFNPFNTKTASITTLHESRTEKIHFQSAGNRRPAYAS